MPVGLQVSAHIMLTLRIEWGVYPIYSVPRLLMSWRGDERGRQQPWNWPVSPGICQSQQQRGLLKDFSYFKCVYKCGLAYTHFALSDMITFYSIHGCK